MPWIERSDWVVCKFVFYLFMKNKHVTVKLAATARART